jgi:hypothetical protein
MFESPCQDPAEHARTVIMARRCSNGVQQMGVRVNKNYAAGLVAEHA